MNMFYFHNYTRYFNICCQLLSINCLFEVGNIDITPTLYFNRYFNKEFFYTVTMVL